MSKLNQAPNKWLSSLVTTLNGGIDHSHAEETPMVLPLEAGCIQGLCREARALPELFSRARWPRMGHALPEGQGVGDGVAAIVEAIEEERHRRAGSLVPIGEKMDSCRQALEECGPCVSLECRRCLEDAVRTLETEYVRLCDAQRFLFDRRVRYLQTGEADDDPEFTIVLERVVYTANQGDDVAASVAQAVHTIVSCLLPYVGGES
jgi:hypothetical protein